LTGQKVTYDKHCKVKLGTYVQVHEKKTQWNQELQVLALRPSVNEQREHYFLSLHTGKRILRNHWTKLSMLNDVVDTVHRLATASKHTGGITLTYKNGNIIKDDDGEEEEDMTEDEPIPVANNNNEEKSMNTNREEKDTEEIPRAITGVEEQENAHESDDIITGVDK